MTIHGRANKRVIKMAAITSPANQRIENADFGKMDNTKAYFKELREKADKIDDVVSKLSITVRNPAYMQIAFDEDKIAGQNAVQEVKKELGEMQEGLVDMNKMLDEIEKFSHDINKMKQEFMRLEEEKQEIEQVFLEMGYQPEEESLELPKSHSFETSMLKSNANNPCDELEKSGVDNIPEPSNGHHLCASTPLVLRPFPHHGKK